MRTFNLLGILFIIFFSSCKKDKTETSTDVLPAATQAGANTFGFVLNGKVFTPKGYSSPYPNLRVLVDPSFNDGNLDIRAYSIENGIMQDMSIGSDSIKAVGIYPITDASRASVYFSKSASDLSVQYCLINNGGVFNRNGYLKITRYDLLNRIVSGEFEVSMVNPNCGYGTPITISQGRFDLKF